MEKNINGSCSAHETAEIKNPDAHIISEIVEYVPDRVVGKTLINKFSGTVSSMFFTTAEELQENTIPFDTFVQIIDGSADVTIGEVNYPLHSGEGMIIPANQSHLFHANEAFKMILTILKTDFRSFTSGLLM